MVLKVNSSEGFATQWTLAQARAQVNDADWMLTVLLKPTDAKGIALLAKQQPGAVAVLYSYLPAVRRVRELTPLAGYEPFFGTDFTYQDLSFVPFGGQKRSSRAPRLTMARRPINWRRRWPTTRTTQRL
jgi:hypothetical protein